MKITDKIKSQKTTQQQQQQQQNKQTNKGRKWQGRTEAMVKG